MAVSPGNTCILYASSCDTGGRVGDAHSSLWRPVWCCVPEDLVLLSLWRGFDIWGCDNVSNWS